MDQTDDLRTANLYIWAGRCSQPKRSNSRSRNLGLSRLFFFSSRRRHTRFSRDWSSDVCSSDLPNPDTVIRCFDSCIGADGAEKYPPITVAEHYLGKLMKASHSRLDAKAADAMTEAR